jgi:replicative DNA helicase
MGDTNGSSTDNHGATTSSTDGISVAVAAARALLGAALLSPDAVGQVVSNVDLDDYPTADLREIARAVAWLHFTKKPVDPITVAERLHRRGSDVPLEQLVEMMNETPSISLAPSYAATVRDYARDRRIVALADDLGRAAYEGNHDGVRSIVAKIVEVAG